MAWHEMERQTEPRAIEAPLFAGQRQHSGGPDGAVDRKTTASGAHAVMQLLSPSFTPRVLLKGAREDRTATLRFPLSPGTGRCRCSSSILGMIISSILIE